MRFFILSLLLVSLHLPVLAQEREIRLYEPSRIHTEHAGAWIALDRGFFGKLNVQVLQTPPNTSPIQSVASSVQEGTIAFGVASPEQILTARQRDRLNVVAVSADFQAGAMRIVSWKPVRSAKDLSGTFAVWNGFEARARCAAGKRWDKLSIAQQQREEIKPWLAGAWTFASAMTYDELIIAQRENRKTGKVFYTVDYKDLGIDWVDHVLFTTEEVVKKHPDVVEGVIRGRYKGFLWMFENFTEGLEILKKTDQDLDLRREIDALAPVKLLMIGPETKRYGLGYIQPKKWERAARDLSRAGVLGSFPDITSVFTDRFPSSIVP